jgi:hypothetical protein
MADGTLKVGTITTSSGSGTITLGQSGETINVSGTAGTGFGKILQVVNTTGTTQRTTTSSSSFVEAYTVDITPSATSSKILILFSTFGYQDTTAIGSIYTIFRDSTNLGDSSKGLMMFRNGGSNLEMGVSGHVFDSPSSTSAITYGFRQKTESGSSAISYISRSGAPTYLTAMEIAG